MLVHMSNGNILSYGVNEEYIDQQHTYLASSLIQVIIGLDSGYVLLPFTNMN